MKYLLLSICLLFLNYSFYSQPFDYLKGSGSILESRKVGNQLLTIRQHKQILSIGNGPNIEDLLVYNIPDKSSGKKIAVLKIGDKILIDQIEEKNSYNNANQEIWLHIIFAAKSEGWICFRGKDPYADGTWSVTELITDKKRNWIVRKLAQTVQISTDLKVRDRPGINKGKVLYALKASSVNSEWNVQIMGITEERDTIDGISDYWLQIKDHKGRVGWIFGGFTDVERGGPKYWTPEALIANYYGNDA